MALLHPGVKGDKDDDDDEEEVWWWWDYKGIGNVINTKRLSRILTTKWDYLIRQEEQASAL